MDSKPPVIGKPVGHTINVNGVPLPLPPPSCHHQYHHPDAADLVFQLDVRSVLECALLPVDQ